MISGVMTNEGSETGTKFYVDFLNFISFKLALLLFITPQPFWLFLLQDSLFTVHNALTVCLLFLCLLLSSSGWALTTSF